MIRVVLDANVVLAGIVGRPDSPPALLLDALGRGGYEAIACPTLVDELRAGLAKPFFRARVAADEAQQAIDAIERAALSFPDPISPPRVLRDPRDDYLVELAKGSSAEAIVTGDRDLLDHDRLEPPVLTAREACIRLGLLAR